MRSWDNSELAVSFRIKANMKIENISTVILIAGLAAVSFAQKSTPETTITTPSDTSKTKPPAEIKPEPEQPEIELPDVLILGKDQYHRTVKDKKELTPETPALIKPEETNEPVSAWFSSDADKPQLNGGDSLAARQIWGTLRGGTYYTFDGNGGYWQKLAKGEAMA